MANRAVFLGAVKLLHTLPRHAMFRTIRVKPDSLQTAIQIPRGVQRPVIPVHPGWHNRPQIDRAFPTTALAFRQDEPLTFGAFRRCLNDVIAPPQTLAIPARSIRNLPSTAPGPSSDRIAQLGQQEATAIWNGVAVPGAEPAPLRSGRRDLDPVFDQLAPDQPPQIRQPCPRREKLGQRHRVLPRVAPWPAVLAGVE